MTGHAIEGPEHILVFGPSKTGTTGVYTAVKNGLAGSGIPARTVFEPVSSDIVDSLFLTVPSTTVMTKVTMDALDAVVPDLRVFDHRIMTVRDPRDIIISSLLFRPLTRRTMLRADESSVHRFIAALEEKEADPAAHSVRDLFSLSYDLGLGRRPFLALSGLFDRQRELQETGLVHVLRYERFVQNDLEDVSKLLGFDVVNSAAGEGSWIGHITRSRSFGEFTRWFREEDLEYFNTMYDGFLRAFGYDLEVPLETDARIDPATSSNYVRQQYASRRAALRKPLDPPWTPKEVSSPDDLSRLIERAEDSDPRVCLRVAHVLLAGHLAPENLPGALEWARRAAQMGSIPGKALTIELLSRLDSDDPALRRELRAWRMSVQPGQRTHTLAEHVASTVSSRYRPLRRFRAVRGIETLLRRAAGSR